MSTADKKRVREPSPKGEGLRDAALRRLCLLDPPAHQDVPQAAMLAGRLIQAAIPESPSGALRGRLTTPVSHVTAGPEFSCEATLLATWSMLAAELAAAVLEGDELRSRSDAAGAAVLLVIAAPASVLDGHGPGCREAYGADRLRRDRFERLSRVTWEADFGLLVAAMRVIGGGTERIDAAAVIKWAIERLEVAGAPWRFLASKTPRPPLDAALRLLYEAKDRACPYVTATQLQKAYKGAGGGTRDGAGIVSDLKRQLGIRSIRNATRDDHRPGEYGYRLDAPTS